ncbi:hypothetical protein EON62_03785, partial [archaeon]
MVRYVRGHGGWSCRPSARLACRAGWLLLALSLFLIDVPSLLPRAARPAHRARRTADASVADDVGLRQLYGECAPYVDAWSAALDVWLARWRAADPSTRKMSTTRWAQLQARGWGITTAPLALHNGSIVSLIASPPWNNRALSLTEMIDQVMDAASPRWDAQGLMPLPRRTLAFLITAEDWPQALKRDHAQPVPMLSSCTTPDAWDIPVPHSALRHQDARNEFNVSSVPWAARTPVAIFRGATTCYA